MLSSISGVILAGGASSRFGGITKAKILVDGYPVISRIISVIGELFAELIIVTNKPEEFQEYPRCIIIQDEYKNSGPLGGIHAALKGISSDAAFVFAGDMPYLDKKIIADQIHEFECGDHDVLVPAIGKFIEPLHAIYKKSLIGHLERRLDESKILAVRDFISELNVGYMYLRETKRNRLAFTNINSPADISRLIS